MEFEIKFKVNEDIHDKSLSLVHVVNYIKRNNGNEITVDELAKASLIYYLERFYDNMVNPHQDLNGLLALGNPNYPLKISVYAHIEKLELPLTHIAKQLKISKATLVNIIENKNMPSLDIFIRLWVLIGCPPLHEILYREVQE